ncbi:hypothetical protein ACOKM5_27170 [Streptomyces sp. BH097]|uniref:DUF7848 domain-containing protein n=1 Tax=unclassified Streptomyces TaxID=2593676 RepID=UPI003BB557D5
MTRSIVREVRWHIGPDTSEGAPKGTTIIVGCATCPEISGVVDPMTGAPEEWAIGHASKHPSHTGYRCWMLTLWRATPMEDDVVPVDPPKADLARIEPPKVEP